MEPLLILILTYTVCTDPPQLNNGKYSGPDLPQNGSVFRYSCNPNFMLSRTSSRTATCTDYGTYKWDADLPKCLSSLFKNFLNLFT